MRYKKKYKKKYNFMIILNIQKKTIKWKITIDYSQKVENRLKLPQKVTKTLKIINNR